MLVAQRCGDHFPEYLPNAVGFYIMSTSYSEPIFATDSPQAQKDRIGQWRISAGFQG